VYARNKDAGTTMDEDDIANIVREFGHEWVSITGGEPYLQNLHSLLVKLFSMHKLVQVETNGSLPLKDVDLIERIAMSPKLPSSGMVKSMKFENMMALRTKDEVKFVISDMEDWCFMIELLKKFKVRCSIVLQPEGGKHGKLLAEKISMNELKEITMCPVRVLPQLHKVFMIR